MKITFERVIIAILAIVLMCSLIKCNENAASAKKVITQQQLEKQKSDSLINDYGQVISTQDVIITERNDELKGLTDSFFHFKKSQEKQIANVIAYYKGKTKTEIKNVDVPYVDTASVKKWEDSIRQQCAQVIDYYEKNTVGVPRQASDSTANYQVNLTVKRDGVTIDSLSIPDTQQLRFVTLKGGFLKRDIFGKRHFILKKQIQVQVLHTNPLIHVTGQNSAIYISPRKGRWLEKAILIGAGIYLGTKL